MASIFGARLRWNGPPSWQQFLDEQKCHTAARHASIVSLLQTIDTHARRRRFAVVALKGAALHDIGIYSAGERPMADVDLLIHEKDAPAATQVLSKCGYVASCSIRRHQIFIPKFGKSPTAGRLGEHVDVPVKVELHARIFEPLPMFPVDITQEIISSSAGAGVNNYPSLVELMMHLLLHSAGNIRARALRLIQLNDIATLAARFSMDDWHQMLTRRVGGRPLWWAFPPLALTSKYYRGSIPVEVISALAADCPRLLRNRARRYQLTDVSWSNIRIEAFPGLEWSRTVHEAAAFISSRIKPNREARAELKEGAAAIPGGSEIGWYERSHRARILRWIFTRPPRVQTLLSVQAALEKPEIAAAAGTRVA